jgi:hypothetical protein
MDLSSFLLGQLEVFDVSESLMDQSPPFRLSRELKSRPWGGSTASVCKRPKLLKFWTLSVHYRIGVEKAQGQQTQLKLFDLRNLQVGLLDHMNDETRTPLQEIHKLNNPAAEFLVLSETRFPDSHLSQILIFTIATIRCRLSHRMTCEKRRNSMMHTT